MIYNLGVLANISDAIRQALRTLMGHLAALIYTMIEYLYNVFIYISRAEILDNEFIQSIYQKVGMILGIFMIFKLIFSLIQSLIDPDKFADKKSGYAAIIQRSVIAIVLLGITPSLFREAFKLQNLIVGGKNSDNVIYKLIAGKSPIGLDDMGRELASDLYFSFYTDEEYPYYDQGINDTNPDSNDELNDNEYKDRFVTENYDHIVEQVKNKEMSFDDTVDYLSLKYFNKYRIEFNEILSIVLGIIVAWMLITYCIQAGARVIQLAYLQLIAPVPILSYISDPDGAFKKWIKQCTTTFLDLFIRLAIIYFVMTLIGNILIQFSKTEGIIFSSTGLPTDDWFLVVLVKLFIILGLMLFAKKVPELLKDLFPNIGGGVASLGFGLGLKKNLLDPLKDVGKSLYNSPLGWGLKGGKKLGTYIDRKAHHLPKPRGKFGQAMDKWLPGRGEVIKQRRQAQEDERQFNRNMEQGQKMYKDFGDDLIVKDDQGNIIGTKTGAFSSKDYASSYLNLERAKAENKKAEQEYQTEYAKYQAAYSRGDQAAIKLAEERIKIAEGNKKAAQGKLELAQKRHDANKKIYTSDAQREETHDYYKKTHKKRSEYPNDIPLQDNASSTEQHQNPIRSDQSLQQQSSQQFQDNPDSFNYDYGDNVDDAPLSSSQYDRGLQSALTKLDDLYNQGASDEEIQQQLDGIKELTERKEKALKRENDHLDDFYDRQDDGFGGQ